MRGTRKAQKNPRKKHGGRYLARIFPTTGSMPGVGLAGTNTPYGSTYVCTPMTSGIILETSSGGSAITGKFFSLADLNAFGSFPAFISAFDQYRIREVEVWLIPGITQSESANPENASFTSVLDLDDSFTGASTEMGLMQKPGALVSSVWQSHYHRFSPRLSSISYDGTLVSPYLSPNDSPWVDTADTAVQYYGIKICVGATGTSWNLKALIRYHLEFRGVFG